MNILKNDIPKAESLGLPKSTVKSDHHSPSVPWLSDNSNHKPNKKKAHKLPIIKSAIFSFKLNPSPHIM